MTALLAIALGLSGGVLAGLFGIGGGILFVPVLVLLGHSQHVATGTSLLAIIPTVAVGTWRQAQYGNVRWRAAAVIGIAAAAAAQGGVFVADALSDRTLRLVFAAWVFVVALQLGWRALRQRPGADSAAAPP